MPNTKQRMPAAHHADYPIEKSTPTKWPTSCKVKQGKASVNVFLTILQCGENEQ